MPPLGKKKNGKKVLPVKEVPLEVLYPKLEVRIRDINHDDGPITEKTVEDVFFWETLAQYRSRKRHEADEEAKANGTVSRLDGVPDDQIKFGDALLTFTDMNGEECVCWNNRKNRVYNMPSALSIMQDILRGQWAGPMTLPGESINPTAVIAVGKYGSTLDGQTKCMALKFACQEFRKNPEKYPFWYNGGDIHEPVIECLLVVGCSEGQKMVRTMDRSRTRTLEHQVYVSQTWDAMTVKDDDKKPRPLIPKERQELSRMLAAALTFLWDRTGWPGYRTASAEEEFQDAHKKAVEACKVIWELNQSGKGRAISRHHLTAGSCAGMLYLMGSAASDKEAYQEDRHEKHLDWKQWDRACEFWREFARSTLTEGDLADVIKALAELKEDPQGMGGRETEKRALVAKAWVRFEAGHAVHSADIELEYGKDAHEKSRLIERPVFGGIDVGDPVPAAAQDGNISDREIALRIAEAERTRLINEKLAEERARRGPSTVVAEPGTGKPGEPAKPAAPKLLVQPLHKRPDPVDANGGPKPAPPQNGALKPAKTAADVIEQFRALKNGPAKGKLLLLRTPRGGYSYDADAEQLAKLLKVSLKVNDKQQSRVEFGRDQFTAQLVVLSKMKKPYALCEEVDGFLQMVK